MGGDPERAQRVVRLAVNIAMTLQVGEPQLSDIEEAAQLSVSPPFERAFDGDGAELPILTTAGALALAAHERYDGTGRPHGLRGDAIPLAARIIRAAAAFDDLVQGGTVDSPGRAVVVLWELRGHEFDPLVIGALRALHPVK